MRRNGGGGDAGGGGGAGGTPTTTTCGKMSGPSQRHGYGYGSGYGYGAYGTGAGREGWDSDSGLPERGSRRRRLAAVAGSVYRAGVAAATELKEQYNSTRKRGAEWPDYPHVSIPEAFPLVSITTKGEEQMMLFPTYAKRHVRRFAGAERFPPGYPFQAANAAQMGMSDEEYWKHEWARVEDEKAVVDVDVRGWIYMPSKGPMTRRNRMLVGLARRLSGIPPPTVPSESTASTQELFGDEQRIAQEAREIERRGQDEKEVATRGGYSEPSFRSNGNGGGPVSPPPSPTPSGRTSAAPASDFTEAELAVANANLMARLGPFMTSPLVQIPITIFFCNEEQSRSHTVVTDDSGHFSARVALEFVPTDVRVIANEDISTARPVEIIEPRGVSLISDIDDTVKRSNISMGAREIFRNTLIRDLADLSIDGVQGWYHALHEMGVEIHYCSNSPWQLFPVLATFFHEAGLPQGSIHLKQYSGMLQGIFEPVAERKKGTLEAIIRDFPERKFVLVGDSGEADLEVYAELAVANPGRILAVFIRDVTTPDQTGFFDSSFSIEAGQRGSQGSSSRARPGDQATGDEPENRPQLPPRTIASSGLAMGTLIDLSDDPVQPDPGENRDATGTDSIRGGQKGTTPGADRVPRKAPPARPTKPAALRSTPTNASISSQMGPTAGLEACANILPRAQTSSWSPATAPATSAPPPPPRRRGTAPAAAQQQQQRSGPHTNADSTGQQQQKQLLTAPGARYSGIPEETASPQNGTAAVSATVDKKVDLWLRRLARAHETLDAHGVRLYTWRKGDDVVAEAVGIVGEALREMEAAGGKSKG